MDVVIAARRADRLEDLARRIRDLGRRAVPVAVDVTDAGASARLLDAAEVELGGFYAVFANAGIGLYKPMHETEDQALREIFEINFFASVDLVRAAAGRLLDAGLPGHLLMCSSCLSKFSIPRHGHYSATKAAQNHVCRAMRMELRDRGIEVASVHPIATRTEFFEVSQDRSGLPADQPTVVERMPRLFVQSPERVARAIVRCLRRPRPEVWTSFSMRQVAAMVTSMPRLLDAILGMKHAQRYVE
jgi:short-subunit dehydrogenase